MFARICAGCLLAAAAGPASANPITTLHSTGTPGTGGADAYYSLVSAPGAFAAADSPLGSGLPAMVVTTPDNSFPLGQYWANNAFQPNGVPASHWIAPVTDASLTQPDGHYTYRTTFDLTGLNPATAAIRGLIAADNAVDVYLNGRRVGRFYAANGYTFTQDSFVNQYLDVTSGFVAGLNTLDFVVYNEVQATGNPTGLRVALAGTADAVHNPEPANLAVFGLGLAGVGTYLRRRRVTG